MGSTSDSLGQGTALMTSKNSRKVHNVQTNDSHALEGLPQRVSDALTGKTVSDTFYKYRDWQNSLHKEVLTKPSLYFASASELNDPRELENPFRFDLVTYEDKMEWLRNYVRNRTGGRWREEWVEMVIQDGEWNPTDHFRRFGWDAQMDKYLMEGIRNNFKENIGICSFSMTHEDNQLWSLYANGHRGFCVGYDRDRFLKYFEFLYLNRMQTTPQYIIIDVEYVEQFPKLIPLSGGQDDTYKMLATKTIDWRHEKEVRLLRANGARIADLIAPELISEVILGAKMDQNHQKKITEIVRNMLPHARLIQAQLSVEFQNLEFIEMDI